MRLIVHLIKNSLKLDLKMLIPFFATIVVIVLVTSASSVSGNLFIEESREPAIKEYGGEVCVYKSSQSAQFATGREGLTEKWYRQLFEPEDIAGFADKQYVTYDLSIWGKHAFLFQMNTQIIGREYSNYTPEWEIRRGKVSQVTDLAEWEQQGRPVTVLIGDKLPLEIRDYIKVGYEFEAFIPRIIESGGVLNLKGADATVILPKDAVGMDYLDYKNGSWITLKIAAIGRDGLGGVDDSIIVMPLNILQELAEAENKVNRAGISMPDNSENEISLKARQITDQYPGFFGLKTTDMFLGTFKSVNDLAKHADLLMYSIYLIGSLMVTCVLILMMRNRRSSDVQLITLGINRSTLAAVAIFEILVVSVVAVLAGVAIPLLLSLLRSGKIVVDSVQLIRFFLIVPFNLIITIIVSQIMLPNSKQCLEALRYE